MHRAEVGKTVIIHTHPAAEPAIDVVALAQPRERSRAANALTGRSEPQRQQKPRARRRLSRRVGPGSNRLFKLPQIELLDVSPDHPHKMRMRNLIALAISPSVRSPDGAQRNPGPYERE